MSSGNDDNSPPSVCHTTALGSAEAADVGLLPFPWHVQRFTQRPHALQAAGSMSGSREGNGGIAEALTEPPVFTRGFHTVPPRERLSSKRSPVARPAGDMRQAHKRGARARKHRRSFAHDLARVAVGAVRDVKRSRSAGAQRRQPRRRLGEGPHTTQARPSRWPRRPAQSLCVY